MPCFGALEAGGTKMVCAVGSEDGKILERISLPTRTPENTMPEMLAFFQGKNLAAIGIAAKYRLMIADPDRGVRETIPYLLDWSQYGVSGIQTAGSYEEAVSRAVDFQPHIALLIFSVSAMLVRDSPRR